MANVCPICGRAVPKTGFCAECEQKIQERFLNDEWEMMEIEEIRNALESPAAPADTDKPAAPNQPARQDRPVKKKRSAPKKRGKKRNSAAKELIGGIVILVLALLSMPLMLGEHVNYLRAKNHRDVTASLQEYRWRWEESKEQYTIEATYRWTMDSSSGFYYDTQTSTKSPGSRFNPGYGWHEGKDSDPSEVRPLSTATLRAYQRPDGTWELVRNSSSKDIFALIGGYLVALLLAGWMIVEGAIHLRKQKQAEKA
ncbi:MAG: hypothetical protein IKS29_02350 [Oscillospiraceae bacterium]|nr:hypothetical protein [Oscillospiraceae bacterium]